MSTGLIISIALSSIIFCFLQTATDSVKEFLEANGFQLKKNNDYFNPELGIILEDLHDENVLTNKGALFFIDTIFYLMPSFFDQTK